MKKKIVSICLIFALALSVAIGTGFLGNTLAYLTDTDYWLNSISVEFDSNTTSN